MLSPSLRYKERQPLQIRSKYQLPQMEKDTVVKMCIDKLRTEKSAVKAGNGSFIVRIDQIVALQLKEEARALIFRTDEMLSVSHHQGYPPS